LRGLGRRRRNGPRLDKNAWGYQGGPKICNIGLGRGPKVPTGQWGGIEKREIQRLGLHITGNELSRGKTAETGLGQPGEVWGAPAT